MSMYTRIFIYFFPIDFQLQVYSDVVDPKTGTVLHTKMCVLVAVVFFNWRVWLVRALGMNGFVDDPMQMDGI